MIHQQPKLTIVATQDKHQEEDQEKDGLTVPKKHALIRTEK
jgi:hypothetical protein